MKRSTHARLIVCLALSLFGLASALSLVDAQDKSTVPAGGAVNVTVTTAAPTAPPVTIILGPRHGHVTPHKGMCTHTGGGLIDVASPVPDTVIVAMTGAVVANSVMQFTLDQCFEVSFDDPKLKKAKLAVEGRVIGLLRGEPHGCAEYTDACVHVNAGPVPILSVCVPPHSACDNANLAVNDHDGPKTVAVLPGTFTLQQTFTISAHSDSLICKRPSAEFAPDPALDPLWISYHEPFHGVKKDTFGFQVILKVSPETEEGKNGKNGREKLPPPTQE